MNTDLEPWEQDLERELETGLMVFDLIVEHEIVREYRAMFAWREHKRGCKRRPRKDA